MLEIGVSGIISAATSLVSERVRSLIGKAGEPRDEATERDLQAAMLGLLAEIEKRGRVENPYCRIPVERMVMLDIYPNSPHVVRREGRAHVSYLFAAAASVIVDVPGMQQFTVAIPDAGWYLFDVPNETQLYRAGTYGIDAPINVLQRLGPDAIGATI